MSRARIAKIQAAALYLLAACDGLAGAGTSVESKSPPVVATSLPKPAFPGAVGYGAVSVGGRGGRIVPVTTLADAGPGSLRACIEAEGPRVCVFRVNGTIRFTQRPPWIRNPFITIAGQTAPGDGITLAHSGGKQGLTPLVIKGTHDVIVRNLRVRADIVGGNREAEDSFTIENSSRVILDHVSASWARDELVNGFGDNDFVTVSNSIFAFGLPRHDKCALLASDPVDAQHFSFIGNICAHNGDRNPDMNFPPGSCVEVINNVFYNAQSEFAEIWETVGGTPVSIIGNSFIAGPNTHAQSVGISRSGIAKTGNAWLYLKDNRFDGDFLRMSPSVPEVIHDGQPCPLTIRPLSAESAYSSVLQHAGTFPRDWLDDRVVTDIRKRQGKIVHSPEPLPPSAASTPYPDSDGDGMDDRWEARHGSDPAKYDPWRDADGNHIPDFDDFLAYLDARGGA